MSKLFKKVADDVIAEYHGFENHEDRIKIIGTKVEVIECFEKEGHEGKIGILSGIDGDFHTVDFPNGQWCLATKIK